MGKSYTLCKIFGIPIKINWSWFVIFALFSWTLGWHLFPQEYAGLTTTTYAVMGVLAALLLFASVLLHELSHSYVAQRFDIPVHGITLFIFGGVSELHEEPRDPDSEWKMALVGPAMSLAVAVVCLGAAYAFRPWWPLPLYGVLHYLGYINVVLAVFNLMPGYPLDGGRILRAILWKRWGDWRRATTAAAGVGSMFANILIVLGIVLVFTYQNLGAGLWPIILGWFLKQAGTSGYRLSMLRHDLAGVSVRDVMRTDVVSIPAGASVEEAIEDFFLRYRYNSCPVVDGERLAGIISLASVGHVRREERPHVRVADVMDRSVVENALRADAEATEALERVMQKDIGKIPVVDEAGLVGIVTRRDILQILKVKMALE